MAGVAANKALDAEERPRRRSTPPAGGGAVMPPHEAEEHGEGRGRRRCDPGGRCDRGQAPY
jgi:hypothetical protein